MPVIDADIQPLTFDFVDDGLVPNSKLPFLVYKRAITVDNGDPERAIEKQPACAAAMSSSGFVPLPSSKRVLNEY